MGTFGIGLSRAFSGVVILEVILDCGGESVGGSGSAGGLGTTGSLGATGGSDFGGGGGGGGGGVFRLASTTSTPTNCWDGFLAKFYSILLNMNRFLI